MSVTIVGAGMAGLRTAEALRHLGYQESITLIGAEAHLPYTRPPLSKEVLRGEAEPTTARLRNDDEMKALGLDVRLGTRATALHAAGHVVTLDDGSELVSKHVVLATGATPRQLPGVPEGSVHLLRSIDDAVVLRDAIQPGAQVIVVGAGFIGLEVAASARARGAIVTVLDMLPVPLGQVLDEQVGAVVRRLHEAHGVVFRLGTGVRSLDVVVGADAGAGVRRVTLDDGTSLTADVVVAGIGVMPDIGWLADSGLAVEDGVVTDACLRAAPGVWAVGDIARWPSPSGVGTLRVEHWTNAAEQPQTVARNIVGAEAAQPFVSVPYFWSDQYDAKLQALGAVGKGAETLVVHGSLDEPKWVALVRDGDRLAGILGLRSPGRVMKFRPLLAAGASWEEAVATATG